MDDTNPTKEEPEYVESIIEDVAWLIGEPPSGGLHYGSDYFPQCYEYALSLIDKGLAFVCDLTADEMRETRGTLTTPGTDSPYRSRSVEENRGLFLRMKNGEFPDGARTLRAKLDMASPNITLRDPVLYRILHAHHYRQGDAWCIYPMYDFAHTIQDALEGITHSLCSYEFVNNRPLYDWVRDNLDLPGNPHQYEFARLNMTYTTMSKRYLRPLVLDGHVDGWDDPRLPTLRALRRRGFTPSSILTFVQKAGVAKVYSVVDSALLDYCIREELNQSAPRRMCVTDPLRVVIENWPADKTEFLTLQNNPEDETAGTRDVPFTREIYIEREDFAEIPPPKFKRLTVGSVVRLMGGKLVTCVEAVKNDAGEIDHLRCELVQDQKPGATIHWLSTSHALDAPLMLYGRLFTLENINDLPEGSSMTDYLNPDSVQRRSAKIEPSLKDAKPGERFQFVRVGYFTPDVKHPGTFLRVVELKDGYKP
jgi:glutaminyl-tRNA synthetase